MLTCAQEAGSRDLVQVASRYEELRGQSYDKIIEEIYIAAGGKNLGMSVQDYEQLVYETAGEVQHGKRTLSKQAIQVEGAQEMLDIIRDSGVPYKITTGSPRAITLMLLSQSGLLKNFTEDQLVCCGDLSEGGSRLNKNDSRYWEIVLDGVEPQDAIGFEDHPHGSSWMLGIANLGKVIVKPSVQADAFGELISTYGDKLELLPAWHKILN
jgi:beta-phosphoglucomutase-like phosphatase (HAD superfamily)